MVLRFYLVPIKMSNINSRATAHAVKNMEWCGQSFIVDKIQTYTATLEINTVFSFLLLFSFSENWELIGLKTQLYYSCT